MLVAENEHGKPRGPIEIIGAQAGVIEFTAEVRIAIFVEDRLPVDLGIHFNIGPRQRTIVACMPNLHLTEVFTHDHFQFIGIHDLRRPLARGHDFHQHGRMVSDLFGTIWANRLLSCPTNGLVLKRNSRSMR